MRERAVGAGDEGRGRATSVVGAGAMNEARGRGTRRRGSEA